MAPGEECDLSAWDEFGLPAVTKGGFAPSGFTTSISSVKLLTSTHRAMAVAAIAPPDGRLSWAPGASLPHWADVVGTDVESFFNVHFSAAALQALCFIFNLSGTGTAKASRAKALVTAKVAPVHPAMVRAWLHAHVGCRAGTREDGVLTEAEMSVAPAGFGVPHTPPPPPSGSASGGPPAGLETPPDGAGSGRRRPPSPPDGTDTATPPPWWSLMSAMQQQAEASNALVRTMAAQSERDRAEAERRLHESQAEAAVQAAMRSKPLLERVVDEAAAAFGALPRARFFDASRFSVQRRLRMANMRPLVEGAGFKAQAKSQALMEADLAQGSKAAADIRQGFRFLFAELAARPEFPATRLKDMLTWWSRLHDLVLPGVQESQRMLFAVAFSERHAALLGQPSLDEEGVMKWAARLHAPGGPLVRQYLSAPVGGPGVSGGGGGGAGGRGSTGSSPRKRPSSSSKSAGPPSKKTGTTASSSLAGKWCWTRCVKANGRCTRGECVMSHWCPSHWKEGEGVKVDHAACDCDAFDAKFAERAAKGSSRVPA